MDSSATVTIYRTVLAQAIKTASIGRRGVKQTGVETAVLECRDSRVTLQIGGALILLRATGEGDFRAALPLVLLRQIATQEDRGKGPLQLAFGPGWLRDGGVTEKNPEVVFEPGRERMQHAPLDSSIPGPEATVYEDATPARIYTQFRMSGPGMLPLTPGMMTAFRRAEAKVERAAEMLEMFGVTREDVDRLIASKSGLPYVKPPSG